MSGGRENLQEAQRRSDETESESTEETKRQTPDLSRDQRDRTNEDEDIHGPGNSQNQRSTTLGSIPSSDKSKEMMKGKGIAESSKKDYGYYLRTGKCGRGTKCPYNHPPSREIKKEICRYYLRSGRCRRRTECSYDHPPNIEIMREECNFYRDNGWCQNRNNCDHIHRSRDKMPICKDFLKGACLLNPCGFQHIKPEVNPENRGVENLQQRNKRQRTEAQDNVQGRTPDLSRDQRNWGRTPDLSSDQRNTSIRISPTNEDEDIHGPENSQNQRSKTLRSIPSSDKSKEIMKGKGIAESSKEDCGFYLRTGKCGRGTKCPYNHPPNREKKKEHCQDYLTLGMCRRGFNCPFNHPNRESMPICQKFLKEDCLYKRCGFRHIKAEVIPENHGDENLQQRNKRQRTEAQDNVQENQALGGAQHNMQENQALVGAQENLQEIPEDQNVAAHQDQPNLEGQGQRDIPRERLEARQRLDQMRRTVRFNDLHRLRKTLEDIGIERRKDDGF